MVKKVAGEVKLQISEKKAVRLRLDIGTMMDHEDHFGVGGALILAERLTKLKMKDCSILFLAMTGGDWNDDAAILKAATQIKSIGLNAVVEAVSECIALTLMPDEAEPGKPVTTSSK